MSYLSIVDEFTRECRALEVDRSITPEKAIDVLVELSRILGVPKHIRSDNGPEFIAKAIQRWLTQAGVETLAPLIRVQYSTSLGRLHSDEI